MAVAPLPSRHAKQWCRASRKRSRTLARNALASSSVPHGARHARKRDPLIGSSSNSKGSWIERIEVCLSKAGA